MDFNRRGGLKRSELYSTVVIHHDDESQNEEDEEGYGTTEEHADADDDESQLPPLLKRLPKDFGIDLDDDDDDDGDYSGTVVVRSRRRNRSDSSSSSMASVRQNRGRSSYQAADPSPKKAAEEEDDGGEFGTFVSKPHLTLQLSSTLALTKKPPSATGRRHRSHSISNPALSSLKTPCKWSDGCDLGQPLQLRYPHHQPPVTTASPLSGHPLRPSVFPNCTAPDRCPLSAKSLLPFEHPSIQFSIPSLCP